MNITSIVLAVLFGGVLVSLMAGPAESLKQKYNSRAPVFRKYWIFVGPYLLVNAAAYILLAIYAPSEMAFGVLGDVSSIILAVYAGYIAFSEFGESKFEKLQRSAKASLRHREFNTAQAELEESHAIKPKNNSVLGDLLEVYIIQGDYEKFNKKLPLYTKNSLEKNEELTKNYLLAIKSLTQEHLREAREQIQSIIEFVNSNVGIRSKFNWRNDELVDSDTFKRMGNSAQKMTLNLYAYLKSQLSEEAESHFVSGNYADTGSGDSSDNVKLL